MIRVGLYFSIFLINILAEFFTILLLKIIIITQFLWVQVKDSRVNSQLQSKGKEENTSGACCIDLHLTHLEIIFLH